MTYAEIADLIARHPVCAVATVVNTKGSSPREPGARMVVLPDGTILGTVGGGTLEQNVVEDAVRLLEPGGTLLKEYVLRPKEQGGIGMVCGGESTVFIEVLGVSDRLLILGGGHVGLELHVLARGLGWETVVVDSRETFAVPDRFPGAREVLRAAYDDPQITARITPRTAVVIVTHSHPTDQAALGNVLDAGAFYTGLIGSKRKIKTIFGNLTDAGRDGADLERVHAPIGLDIGADSPAEIALSILAEVLAVRKGVETPGGSLREKKGG